MQNQICFYTVLLPPHKIKAPKKGGNLPFPLFNNILHFKIVKLSSISYIITDTDRISAYTSSTQTDSYTLIKIVFCYGIETTTACWCVQVDSLLIGAYKGPLFHSRIFKNCEVVAREKDRRLCTSV